MLTEADILTKLKSGAVQVEIIVKPGTPEFVTLETDEPILFLRKIFILSTRWDPLIFDVSVKESELMARDFLPLLSAIYVSESPSESFETIRLMWIYGFLTDEEVIYKGMLYTRKDLLVSPSIPVTNGNDLLH